jgi:hypothetical protein
MRPRCAPVLTVRACIARWCAEALDDMMEFLFLLPRWLLALVLNAWLMGFGLVGIWFVRRYVLTRMRLRYDDAYFGAAVLQSTMMLYGLVAALTAVSVWQRYSDASSVVSSEATSIASLWRDLGGYPQPQRDAMRGVLRGYTEQVINEAWPLQRQGEIPSQGVEWMDRLQEQLFAFEPVTESQKIIHAETLGAFNDLVEHRRQRLDAVQAGLPTVLWYVLMPGAMVCILLSFFFHVDNGRFEAVLVIGLAGSLAMVLFLIIALDRPLRGEAGIGPDSYQLIYDHHMRG